MSRPTVSLLTTDSPRDWRYLSSYEDEKFYQNSKGEVTTGTYLFNKNLRESNEKREQQKLDDDIKKMEAMLEDLKIRRALVQQIEAFQLKNANM
jgi:hypothetical protein